MERGVTRGEGGREQVHCSSPGLGCGAITTHSPFFGDFLASRDRKWEMTLILQARTPLISSMGGGSIRPNPAQEGHPMSTQYGQALQVGSIGVMRIVPSSIPANKSTYLPVLPGRTFCICTP